MALPQPLCPAVAPQFIVLCVERCVSFGPHGLFGSFSSGSRPCALAVALGDVRFGWVHAGERAGATYRWDRDDRSLKEPSGTLEMSLPCRVLQQSTGRRLAPRADLTQALVLSQGGPGPSISLGAPLPAAGGTASSVAGAWMSPCPARQQGLGGTGFGKERTDCCTARAWEGTSPFLLWNVG